jgi:hypothetical protein
MGWFARWRKRERDLAAGVDADLVAENRKRRNLALLLLACSLLLIGIQAKIKLPNIASKIAQVLTIACFLGSFVLGRWAAAEYEFLHRPDRPEPPSLWRFRSRR